MTPTREPSPRTGQRLAQAARLHAAGLSLSECARSLGLSRQRLHQIIEAHRGAWQEAIDAAMEERAGIEAADDDLATLSPRELAEACFQIRQGWQPATRRRRRLAVPEFAY